MEFWKKMWEKIKDPSSPYRKIAGGILILIGVLALLTPFTPGSWLIFVGLGFFGIRLAAWERIKVILKNWYARIK